VRIFVTNLGKYNNGELIGQWLQLPCSDLQIQTALKVIGIGEGYEEYFITDYENDYGLKVGEYTNIHLLNEIAESIDNLDKSKKTLLHAVIELDCNSLSQVKDILDELSNYMLYPNITNDEELGRFYIYEIERHNHETITALADYIDFEAYGRDIRINSKGDFTSYGWAEKQ